MRLALLLLLRLAQQPAQSASNATHCSADFCTWWHATGELNADTPVAPGAVRQSRHYLVSVAAAGAMVAAAFSPSFVHEAIPRNGNGRIFSPRDTPNSDTLPAGVNDGVSIEPSLGLSMAWSHFEHRVDVDVKIMRTTTVGGGAQSGDRLLITRMRPGNEAGVTIRPRALGLVARPSGDGGILIRVPVMIDGGADGGAAVQRALHFSVEFADDLATFRSDGSRYVTHSEEGAVVGVEPTHALLLRASPFLPPDATPAVAAPTATVHTMVPGVAIGPGMAAQQLGAAEVIVFPPGVYWAAADAHLRLSPATRWVHFEAGAYVKGALEYTSQASAMLATGHGVLSGERYVYQANTAANYTAVKSDQHGLRMWWHNSAGSAGQPQQTWRVEGPTVASPPFNSMDFNGPLAPAVSAADYAQVGAFFFQTDGPELYSGSRARDIFLHVNDDAVKAYHSNVTLARLTVWKIRNDPVVQMGWASRNVSGVTILGLTVIHTRYAAPSMSVPSAIFGASGFYAPSGSGGVKPNMLVALDAEAVICEGMCPALLRLTPLQSYALRLRNVAFPDGLISVGEGAGGARGGDGSVGSGGGDDGDLGLGESRIPRASPAVTMGLTITNWSIGDEMVTMSNFQSNQLGQLDIDVSYWGQWVIS